MTAFDRVIEPDADAARAYDRILTRYKNLYGALKTWRETPT